MADFNRIVGFSLKCKEMVETEKSYIAKCFMSGKKKEDGSYAKGMFIDVVITADTEWEEGDLTGKYLNVDGNFSLGEYTTKAGETRVTYTIFAKKITEHTFEDAK